MHLLVRYKVFDFTKWKSGYDADLSARQKAGLKEIYLFRNADDPNEVTLLFSVEDVHKARAFVESDDLHHAMEKAGVMGAAEVSFLNYTPATDRDARTGGRVQRAVEPLSRDLFESHAEAVGAKLRESIVRR